VRVIRRRGGLIVIVVLAAALALVMASCGEQSQPSPGVGTPASGGQRAASPASSPAASPIVNVATPAPTPAHATPEVTTAATPAVPAVAVASGNDDIYVMDSGGGNVRRLTDNPERDLFPTWSPDGRSIAFHSNREGQSSGLYVMEADGSNPRLLTSAGGSDPAWSPDGTRIAFTTVHGYNGDYPEIYVVGIDGSGLQQVTNYQRVPTTSLYMGSGSAS
jgi:TolB protein